MFHAAERLKVRFMVLVRWKLSLQRKLESLRLFEATEDDSAWQLLRASEHLQETHLKAELFGQIMEETFHADEFRRVYQELSGKKMEKLLTEKKPLYPPHQAKSIFAYCLIGEASAAQRFSHLAEVLSDDALKQALQRILSDEVGHIHKAQEILKNFDLKPEEVKRKLLEIRLKRLAERWLRMGRQITDFAADVFLSIIYFCGVGPFAGLMKMRRKS